jgi:hypothetical protein
VVFQFFDEVLGCLVNRAYSINLDMLDNPRLDLHVRGEHFTEDEILRVIKALPADKAPMPDGFAGCFLQVAWSIISDDVMAVFDTLWHANTHNFHVLNEALTVWLPKNTATITIETTTQSLLYIR